MIGNNFFDIMMHYRFTGGQSYVLLCTETTLSNPPEIAETKTVAKSRLHCTTLLQLY